MELVAPAGNIDKLYYAYTYGADAVYIGLKGFSLRVQADNFYEDEYRKIAKLKKQYPAKRLFCALNIMFHNRDMEHFAENVDYFRHYPIDAFIVQDMGIVPLLKKNFPDAALHLSTQASCINSSAVKVYRDMGFRRIVLGREASLDEIRQIKDAVPEMELEAFCHGAMCIAYSGRCLMSAYLTGRSAQSGFCSQSCRWNYDVLASQVPAGMLALEEHERPGEYFPVFEGDGFTAVLSSKDLRMIVHLDDMRKAGIDAIKIEGRMKSIYYVALVTRAYRKALDVLDGKLSRDEAQPFIDELDNVSHRESTTGFYYSRADADKTTSGAADSQYLLAAAVNRRLSETQAAVLFEKGRDTLSAHRRRLETMHPAARAAAERDYAAHPEKVPAPVQPVEGWYFYQCRILNKFDTGSSIEFVTPDTVRITAAPGTWQMTDPESGTRLAWVCSGHACVIYTGFRLPDGALVRVKDSDYVPGRIRDHGRKE